MKTEHALVLAALLSSGTVAAGTGTTVSPSTTPFAEGTAFDRDSGAPLYRERHFCDAGLTQCTVRYVDNGGNLIARKELDYSQSATSPSLVLKDYRRDAEVRIPSAVDNAQVVDAGFDNFVRAQWDTLADGETVTFRFRGVGFDSPLDMKIGIDDKTDCDPANLCLAVNIDSWLLSSFLDPIQLHYSRSDRRLQRYSGISNLKGATGESLDVDIYYAYPDAGSTTPSSDELVYTLATGPGR